MQENDTCSGKPARAVTGGRCKQSRDILVIIYGLASSAWWEGLNGRGEIYRLGLGDTLSDGVYVSVKTRLAIFFETLPEPRTGTPQWERQPVLVALAEAFPST